MKKQIYFGIIRTHGMLQFLLPLVAITLLTSCSRQKEINASPDTSNVWSSLVTADADLILIADITALRKSPWYKKSQITRTDQQEELNKKAGFSQNDVSMLLISSDLDSLPQLSDLQTMTAPGESNTASSSALHSNLLANLNTSMFIFLDKEISWDQAKEAVKLIFSATIGTKINETPDKPQLVVRQDSSPVPLFITLSDNNRIIQLRTTENSMHPAGGNPSIKSFIEEYSFMQTNGPIRTIMLVSSAMQQKIKKAIEGPSAETPADRSSTMMSGLLKPFAELKSISLALDPHESYTGIYCSMDVGSEKNAAGAEALMQSVLIPLITLAVSQQTPDLPPNLVRETSTSTKGSRVILNASLNTQAAGELNPQIP